MFTEKIKKSLKEQGRTKVWLAEQVQITYKTLFEKLNNNSFSVSEVFYISHLLNIKD